MHRKKSLYSFDRKNFSAHILDVVGIDEAGRGPLAGPVAAGAVILNHQRKIYGLNDSKKLSEREREKLFEKITSCAKAWAVGFAPVSAIDKKGILRATFQAARKALKKLKKQKPTLAIFDGNIPIPRLGLNQKTLIRGDEKSACVAAASIVAKVARDRAMKRIASKYPEYGFENHKGYGTKAHYKAIKQWGLTKHHRRSFFKKGKIEISH